MPTTTRRPLLPGWDSLRSFALRRLLDTPPEAPGRTFGPLSLRLLIRREVPGRVRPDRKRRLCAFSHYDPDNVVDGYVLYHLEQLARFAEIVFVTACTDLPAADVRKLRAVASRVVFRENAGRDFGAWRVGLACARHLRERPEVVLTNDSVYGPLFDLGPVFEEMSYRDLDLWGLTESWERAYHVQSYFVAARRRLVNSRFFANFWRRFAFETARNRVIERGEIAFSQDAGRRGFRLGAMLPYRDLRNFILRRRPDHPCRRDVCFQTHNPTHYYWDILLNRFRCPYVKVNLLRDNAERIPDVGRWEEVVKGCSGYDTGLIRRHLQRVGRP